MDIKFPIQKFYTFPKQSSGYAFGLILPKDVVTQ